MEVVHQFRRKGLALRANRVPRLENQEADDLTNLKFKSFDSKKRLNVDLKKLDFGVLRQLSDVGDSYVKELDELKAQAKARAVAKDGRKLELAGESLRERERSLVGLLRFAPSGRRVACPGFDVWRARITKHSLRWEV